MAAAAPTAAAAITGTSSLSSDAATLSTYLSGQSWGILKRSSSLRLRPFSTPPARLRGGRISCRTSSPVQTAISGPNNDEGKSYLASSGSLFSWRQTCLTVMSIVLLWCNFFLFQMNWKRNITFQVELIREILILKSRVWESRYCNFNSNGVLTNYSGLLIFDKSVT